MSKEPKMHLVRPRIRFAPQFCFPEDMCEDRDYHVDKFVVSDLVPENATSERPAGMIERRVEKDYPITPDYVQSFADSTDYKTDLERAVGMPARGSNVGDFAGMEEFMNLDTEEQIARISKLNQLVEDRKAAAAAAAAPKDQSKEDNNG